MEQEERARRTLGFLIEDSCERSLRGSRANISKIGNGVKRHYVFFLVFLCKLGRECSSGQGPLSLLSGGEVCQFNRRFQQ